MRVGSRLVSVIGRSVASAAMIAATLVSAGSAAQAVQGGSDAATGSRPFQVLVQGTNCGGSLISPRTVLTAAHCVSGVAVSNLSVRYNTVNRAGGSVIGVSSVRVNSSFSQSTHDYDVALLILSTAFTPGANAGVVPLASTVPTTGAAVQVSGFGFTTPLTPVLSQQLKIGTETIAGSTTCQGAYSPFTTRMLCAATTGVSACTGDDGGPLTYNGTLVGVVSFRQGSGLLDLGGCRANASPDVYASVPALRAFIDANTV